METRAALAVGTSGLLFVIAVHSVVTGFERPTTSLELPEATGVIKLEFGLKSQEPAQWEGTLKASDGEILSTWGWHFIELDRIVGKNGWSFRIRLVRDPEEKYKGQDRLPEGFPVLPNGVYAAIKAADSAVFTVSANRGAFSFKLSE